MSSMTCEHSDELLTLGAMRLLSAAEETRLEEQLSACPACRARWREYQALVGAMPQLVLLETAPSQSLGSQPAPIPNGKAPHLPGFFEAGALGAEPETGDLSIPRRPSASKPQQRFANRRLVKVLSGLAAAVVVLGLIGGFWLLFLSHTPRPPTITEPTKTIVIYNPCSNDIAKGVPGAPPPCGVVVMDYSQTPPLLEEIDPTTGQPLAIRSPLAVGNALLAALSADHLTLALGIFPNGASPALIQIVSLDTWALGPKLQMQLTSTQNLLNLAITSDGTGIYALIDDYTQSATQAILQRYTYNREQGTLTFAWSKLLPFAAGKGIINDGSFALSADDKTAYLFSAATNPAQLAAVPLTANGIGSPHILPLPSIANGATPPLNDENYQYKPGDLIYTWYQPAVIFVPEQNKLYLVHAEAQDPSKDVLVVIDLANMTLGSDIPIHEAGQTQAALPVPVQSNTAASNRPVTVQPQLGAQPHKESPYNGRSETGTVSPDGRWIYLSGTITTAQFNSDETWAGEQETYLGLLKIDAHTGQIVEQQFQGALFSSLAFGQDGRNLYLFGPPSIKSQASHNNFPDVLLVFDTQQEKVVSAFSTIPSGWFILPLP